MSLAPPLQQIDGTFVLFRGKKLSYFGGCDYFRLSAHPRILRRLRDGLSTYGLNVAASRRTSGNHQLYADLEMALKRFFKAPDAVLVSNGYMANLAVAQALAGMFSHALIDARAHSSLVDASLFLICPVVQFQHRNASDLASQLARLGKNIRPIVLTDGLFAHDGSVAPLRKYFEQLPADGLLLADDAHGAGVLGRNGRGAVESENVPRPRVVQTVTLSKSFGVYGGAILASREICDRVRERSAIFIGNTPMPLPLASAALEALDIFSEQTGRRMRLARITEQVKVVLRNAGFELPETVAPIVPVLPENEAAIKSLRQRLISAGIFPPFVRYPGGPVGGYFRFVLSSEHTSAQVENLIATLLAWKKCPPRSS
jgi:7-keto-8-aminopelargonate synthetase-like enzyme